MTEPNDKLVEGMIPEETETKKQEAQVDEYEQSAQMFHILHSQFRKMGYSLANRKKRAAIRVLEAVLFRPLEDVKVVGKEEQELVDIALQVMYHKNKIAEYAVKQKMNKEENNG